MMNYLMYYVVWLLLIFFINIFGYVSTQAVPVHEKEVSVGSVISIKVDPTRTKKVLKTLMPNWLVSIDNDTVYEGVPSAVDVGVHVIPELNLAIRVTPESTTLEACSNRLSPTGALVAIDAEPSRLSPRARVELLRSFASHLHLNNDTRLRLLSSSASATLQNYLYRLASGPGDVPTVKRASTGSFIAWRVGCGAILASELEMLQRMEKSAVTGELHRVIGYSVLHWLVGDDHTRSMLRRRRRRKRFAPGDVAGASPGTAGGTAGGAGSPSNAEEEPGSGLSSISGLVEGSGPEVLERSTTKNPPKGVSASPPSSMTSTRSAIPVFSPKVASSSSSDVTAKPSRGKGSVHDSSSSKGAADSSSTTLSATPASSIVKSTLSSVMSVTPIPRKTTTIIIPSTPMPDSIPVIVHELKKIIVVVGDKLSYPIPRSTFNDTEDGSANLRLQVFKEGSNAPLTNDSTGWISYDKKSARLYVSRVTSSLIGSYKFVVCAFDSKNNKICGPQVIEIKREASLRTVFEVCRGEHFQRFLREEELEYLEKKLSTKNMDLQISSDVTSLDWIKFNSSGRIFFGLPPPNWPIGTSTFKLIAINKGKNEQTILVFKVNVKPARLEGITHRFVMSLNVPASVKKASLPYMFASRISEASGLSIDKVMVLQVSVKPVISGRARVRRFADANGTIVWTDRRRVSLTECPVQKVRSLVDKMVDFEIATRTLIYQKAFKEKMRPFELVEPLKADGVGPCMGRSFLPTPPSTTSTTTTTPIPTTSTPLPTTTTPKRKVTVIPPRSSLTSLTVFTGLAFRSRLKLNKIDMDPRLYRVIFTDLEKNTVPGAPSDQVTVPRSSWIQLDQSDLSLYGLPLKRSEGTSAFSLTILSRNGTESHAILPLNVSVVKDEREHLVNNLVRMQLRKSNPGGKTEEFRKPVLYALRFRLNLVRILGEHLEGSTCSGSSCQKNIAIRQMSVDAEGNLVFEWSWRAMYESADCNRKQLKQLNTLLLAWDGSTRVVLQSLQDRLRILRLIATSVNVMPQGSCRAPDEGLRSTPPAPIGTVYTVRTPPVRDRGLRQMIPNFLVVAVIPICAFLILVLVVALIVACCLHHKRKMHMRRRRGIDKPKRAVVFEEEMDEHPNHASKPLILPNEKPPLPPPDYATEVMPTPGGHEEHIPLTTTSPYRHATNGGSTFRPDQPPMINT